MPPAGLSATKSWPRFTTVPKQLKAANALDFDDIITLTVRLFWRNPEVLEHYQNRYRYIMVDGVPGH